MPKLFDAEEMRILLGYAKTDEALIAGAAGRKDATGQVTKLTLWNHAGDDLYGMFSRSPRIVDRMEQLLGGEVYHYHTKMMLKEPRVGGAWEWHQDYGYWYHNGCLFPLLASCLIAVDRATKENGCLQVLAARTRWAASSTARPATRPAPTWSASPRRSSGWSWSTSRPSRATRCSSTATCCTARTRTARTNPRWSLICCYNAARNDPYKESRHPRYTPLAKVSDSAIKRVASRPAAGDVTADTQ